MPLGPFRDVNNIVSPEHPLGGGYHSVASDDRDSRLGSASITESGGRYQATLERSEHFEAGRSYHGRPLMHAEDVQYDPAMKVGGSFRTPARAKIASEALDARLDAGQGEEYETRRFR